MEQCEYGVCISFLCITQVALSSFCGFLALEIYYIFITMILSSDKTCFGRADANTHRTNSILEIGPRKAHSPSGFKPRPNSANWVSCLDIDKYDNWLVRIFIISIFSVI